MSPPTNYNLIALQNAPISVDTTNLSKKHSIHGLTQFQAVKLLKMAVNETSDANQTTILSDSLVFYIIFLFGLFRQHLKKKKTLKSE